MKMRFFSIFLCFIMIVFCACQSQEKTLSRNMQNYPTNAKNYVPKSKIYQSHSIIIPTSDGQKITVPTKETEISILWAEPNKFYSDVKSYKENEKYFNKYLTNLNSKNIIGEISELEKLLASHYLNTLLSKNRALTARVIKRAENYLPFILEELKKRSLPLELVALPMIESSYVINAVSHAGASGLWQIMPNTGKSLGLTINSNVDERFSFHESTKAALDYLEILYKRFGNWPLALSAYNCGEGRLINALRISRTNNLVDLLEYCKKVPKANMPLPTETQRYVPQFIAAFIAFKEFGVLPTEQNKKDNTEEMIPLENINTFQTKNTQEEFFNDQFQQKNEIKKMIRIE